MGMGPMGAGFPGDPLGAPAPQGAPSGPGGAEGAMLNARALQGNVMTLRNM